MGVCCSNSLDHQKSKNSSNIQIFNRNTKINELKNYVFYEKINEDQNIKIITLNNKISFMNKYKQIWLKLFKEADKLSKNINTFDEKNNIVETLNFHNQFVTLSQQLYKNNLETIMKNLIKGPPNNIRWSIWMGVAKGMINKNLQTEDFYLSFLNNKLSNKLTEQINKDLHRTAPEINFFKLEEGRQSLFNILKAFALYDEGLGYCQGINILAANILLVSDGNEAEAFYFIIFLFEHLNIREFYTKGFPKVHLFIYIIKRLIQTHLPIVFDKIQEISIPDEIWLFKWIQSLFSLTLDFSIGIRLWDCIIANGVDFILNFTLGFVKHFQNEILKSEDMVEFVEIFKNHPLLNNKNINKIYDICEFREKLITLADSFKISDKEIDILKSDYINDPNNVNIYYEEGSFYSNNDNKNNKECKVENIITKSNTIIKEINNNINEDFFVDKFSYSVNKEKFAGTLENSWDDKIRSSNEINLQQNFTNNFIQINDEKGQNNNYICIIINS